MVARILTIALIAASTTMTIAAAQTCNAGEVLIKNDALPAVPSGATAVGLVPGMCDSQPLTVGLLQGCIPGGQITPAYGEAMVAKLDISSWQTFTVTSVAFMVAHATGSPGLDMIVNVEVYDSLAGSPGNRQLGTLVFDLAAATGNNAQVFTHGINTVDLSPYNVVVNGPEVVIVVRILFNLNGSCTGLFGNSVGFAVDLAGTTQPDVDFIHGIDICTGAPLPALIDAATLGQPFFSGDWIVRCCGIPGAAVNPNSITFLPTASVTSPGVLLAQFSAPNDGGAIYVPIVSCTAASASYPPIPDPLPVLIDFCTQYSQTTAGQSVFALTPSNPGATFGFLDAAGNASGVINVPAGLSLSAFPIHLSGVVLDAASFGYRGLFPRATFIVN